MSNPISLKGVSFENLIDPNAPSYAPTPPPQAPPAGITPPASVVPPVVPPTDPPTPPTPPTPPANPSSTEPPIPPVENDPTPLSIFKENLGYEVEGEFDESLDGLIDYTRAAIPVAAKGLLNEFFEKFPEVQMLAQHLDGGNSVDTFVMQFQQPEFVKVSLSDKTDFKVLENIVKQDLSEKGYTQDDIDMVINSSKEKNNLLDRAKSAQTEIEKRFNQNIAGRKQAEIEARNAEIESEKQTLLKVNQVITSGKLPNATIPDSDKKGFMDFVTSIGEDGMTERDKMANNLSIEELLYIDYMLYKGAVKSKNNVDSSKKSIYDSLLGDRSTKRMDGSGEKTTPSSKLKDPKNLLGNVEFKDLIG